MIPLLDRLEFVLGEAVSAMRRNGWMTVASINTAAVALLVFGGLGYAYLSLVRYMDTLPGMFDLLFSVEEEAGGADSPEVAEMARQLREVDGVAAVVFLPKETEWPKYVERLGYSELTGELDNPLPNQFRVRLTNLDKADTVKSAIAEQEHFVEEEGIRDAVKEREFVTGLIHFIRIVGLFLGVVTFFTAGTLILNTVHLTVLARRQEIRIMRMGGASHGMIRWPFLLEGGIQGALGGVLAGLSLWAIWVFVLDRADVLKQTFSPGSVAFPAMPMILVLAFLGMCLGMIAASLSVKKYMRVAS